MANMMRSHDVSPTLQIDKYHLNAPLNTGLAHIGLWDGARCRFRNKRAAFLSRNGGSFKRGQTMSKHSDILCFKKCGPRGEEHLKLGCRPSLSRRRRRWKQPPSSQNADPPLTTGSFMLRSHNAGPTERIRILLLLQLVFMLNFKKAHHNCHHGEPCAQTTSTVRELFSALLQF